MVFEPDDGRISAALLLEPLAAADALLDLAERLFSEAPAAALKVTRSEIQRAREHAN